MIAAFTLNGNNKSLSWAWVIVLGWSTEHWFYSFKDLEIACLQMKGSGLTLISDREKELENAAEE
jgi:hypothetical protein